MPRFPPRSPGGSRSRASTVLSRHYDFLTPISPHFVSFVWRYHPVCRWLRVSRWSRHEPQARRFWGGTPFGAAFEDGDGRISQVPVEPLLSIGHVLRPRSAACVSPKRRCTTAPDIRKHEGYRHCTFRGSIAWHLDLLSTLRSGGLPTPRKTRFQSLVKLSWAGLNPQGSYGRISFCFLTLLPPSPSSLGAIPIGALLAECQT